MSDQDSSTPQSDAFWAKYYATTDPRGEAPEEFTRRLEQQIGALQGRVAQLTSVLEAIDEVPTCTDAATALEKIRKMVIDGLEAKPDEGCKSFWCYFTPDGNPLPSTVRQRPGDAQASLMTNLMHHRGLHHDSCKLGRVVLAWSAFEFPRRRGCKL